MSVDVVIVGAGPAGVTAAAQCTRFGLTVELLDKTGVPGGLIGNAYLIENYPGLEIPITGPVFAIRLAQFLARFDVTVKKETVRNISRNEGESLWQVNTNDRVCNSRYVVVACGTTPKTLSFVGREIVESENCLFYEVSPLLRRFMSHKVIIVGGGDTSFDYALSIVRSGGEATILCREPSPCVRGPLYEIVRKEPRISLLLESELIRVRKVDGQLKAEIGQNAGKSGSCLSLAIQTFDALLVAIGRTGIVRTLVSEPFCDSESLSATPGVLVCGDARLGTTGQGGIAVGDALVSAQRIMAHIAGTH